MDSPSQNPNHSQLFKLSDTWRPGDLTKTTIDTWIYRHLEGFSGSHAVKVISKDSIVLVLSSVVSIVETPSWDFAYLFVFSEETFGWIREAYVFPP